MMVYYSVRSMDNTKDLIYVDNHSYRTMRVDPYITLTNNVAFQLQRVYVAPGFKQCIGWVAQANSCCKWRYNVYFKARP